MAGQKLKLCRTSHDPGKVYDRSNQKFLSKTMAAKVIFKAKIITMMSSSAKRS